MTYEKAVVDNDFIAWVDTNPSIPPGSTHWEEYQRLMGDGQRRLVDYEW